MRKSLGLFVFYLVLSTCLWATPVSANPSPSPSESPSPSASPEGSFNLGSSTDSRFQSEDTFINEGGNQNIDIGNGKVELPNKDSINNNQGSSLKNWKSDLESDGTSTVAGTFRAVIMFLGILLTVYSIGLYFVYLVDKHNNLIAVSLMSIYTLGRLELSPDGEYSTFKNENIAKKQVTHRDITIICIGGIALGVFILTGKVFIVVSEFAKLFSR